VCTALFNIHQLCILPTECICYYHNVLRINSHQFLNSLKPKLVYIIFKNSVRTSKRTQHFTITRINLLTLVKEVIAVYTVHHNNNNRVHCSIRNIGCLRVPSTFSCLWQ
jgi:hypothetical protein